VVPVIRRGQIQQFLGYLCDRRNQRESAALRAAHQQTRNKQTVDLVGPFKNAINARIPKGARRRELLGVTVSTMNLQCFVGDIIEDLAPPPL